MDDIAIDDDIDQIMRDSLRAQEDRVYDISALLNFWIKHESRYSKLPKIARSKRPLTHNQQHNGQP
jgi:hypothetical protein